MAKCVACEASITGDSSTVKGLCSCCLVGLEKKAELAEFSLLKPPAWGQRLERQVGGIKVWWWRDRWRAEKA